MKNYFGRVKPKRTYLEKFSILNFSFFIFLSGIIFLGITPSSALTIPASVAFGVADDCGGPGGDCFPGGQAGIGTHSHFNSGTLDIGIVLIDITSDPIPLTIIEEVRGLAEFDISGLGNFASATLDFQTNINGGSDDINVFTYTGNNAEDLSDFQIATTGFIPQFSTGGLEEGDILSFNVTSSLLEAISNGDDSFGVKFQVNIPTFDPTTIISQAFGPHSFHQFEINTVSAGAVVPEPSSLLSWATGLIAVGVIRRWHKNAGSRS